MTRNEKEALCLQVVDQINEHAENEDFDFIIGLFSRIEENHLLDFLSEERKQSFFDNVEYLNTL